MARSGYVDWMTIFQGGRSDASNCCQLYGQQDRYVLSLKSAQMVGGYSTVNKVHLPPSDYSYSDTGMLYDEASSK